MHPVLIFAIVLAVPFFTVIGGLVIAVLLGRPAECWRIMLPLFLTFAAVAVGTVVYVMATGPVRGVGIVLAMGTLSGVASTLLCCWPLLSMPGKQPTPVAAGVDHSDRP